MVARQHPGNHDFPGQLTLNDKQDLLRQNLAALEHWYGALGKRDSQPAVVQFMGDSLTEGGFASTKALSFTRQYTDAIQRLYRVGGRGWMPCFTYNADDTVASGGTLKNLVGINKYTYEMVGTSQTLTYTLRGDRARIVFSGLTGTGNAEIVIDGGSPITFATVAPNNSGLKYVYDTGALTDTLSGKLHTIVVRGASGNTVRCDGLFEYNGDWGKGVHVWGTGHSGHTASEYTSAILDHWTAVRDVIKPDLVFIQFGGNDQAAAVSKATFKANIASIIDNVRASAPHPSVSIVLLSMWARGDSPYTDAGWKDVYREAMRELVTEKSVAYFDMYDLAGWLGDTGTTAVDDLVCTSGSATITSTKARFRTTLDNGVGISQIPDTAQVNCIPAGTTISSVTSPTQATMSANATANSPAGGLSARLTGRKDPEVLTDDLVHPNDFGSTWIRDGLMRLTTGLTKQANVPQGTADAAGDLLVADAIDSISKLTVGPADGLAPIVVAADAKRLQYLPPKSGHRQMEWMANAGGTGFTSFGFTPTATSPTAAVNDDQADGPYVRLATSAVLNNDCMLADTFNRTRPAWQSEFWALIRTHTDITNIRIWAGLFSGSPVASADPTLHGAGFRYDTGADGTAFWRAWTNDNSGGGLITTLSQSIAVSTRYLLRIQLIGVIGTNATAVLFSINGVPLARHTTNLPGGSSNNLGMHIGARTLVAGSRGILLGRGGVAHA